MALVRHGRTGWNRIGRFTGWVDAPLDDEGRRQAQRVGERLTEISPAWDAVYTSLLVRTIETADLAAAQLSRRPAMIRDRRGRLFHAHTSPGSEQPYALIGRRPVED